MRFCRRPREVTRQRQEVGMCWISPQSVKLYRAGEKDQGAMLVREPSGCVGGGCLVHQRRVQFEGCVPQPLQTITASLLGSKRNCLLLRIV